MGGQTENSIAAKETSERTAISLRARSVRPLTIDGQELTLETHI
jgi:hypothetical protein